MALPKLLQEKLSFYRKFRRFDPQWYLERKQDLLEQYFSKFNISACIVGVSGGIDSAVVAGILSSIAKKNSSPLQEVYAIQMPIFESSGCTNQPEALERGSAVISQFNLKNVVVDLSVANSEMKRSCDLGFGLVGKPWASGQLVSYIRTPAIYYIASLLNEKGKLAVVCGTTNRDEGAYIGFFGKASDGMVDLQIISDIHKSEVYKLAELLDVPNVIREAVPSGDVYDGKSDLEMIGMPYDCVELYSNLLCDASESRHQFYELMSNEGLVEGADFFHPLELLHRTNLHKYLGGTPAIHFDVYERAVPEGWKGEVEITPALNAQIRTDPIYRSAAPLLKTEKALSEAGLFLETQSPDASYFRDTDYSWYATPLFKIVNKLKQFENSSRKKAVLITTGALCPVHSGHLHMMESAKAALDSQGYDVVGGFLSPSHDEYVSKKCGSKALSALHRISLCRDAIEDSDWIGVDTWESLYAGRDVNFTKTVWRLNQLLESNLKRSDVEVFYVCGGDNAKFAKSFIARFGCVVIPRGNRDMEEFYRLSKDPLVASNKKIIFATDCRQHAGNSSLIRQGDVTHMESKSAKQWVQWQNFSKDKHKKAILNLRDVGSSTVEGSQSTREEKARKEFLNGLVDAFKSAFQSTLYPDNNHFLDLNIVSLADQINALNKINLGQTISLDPFYRGNFQIQCSRHFELGDSSSFLGVLPRPGTSSLREQINKIPNGTYTLVDDDRASGCTVNSVLSQLPESVHIKQVLYLSELLDFSVAEDDLKHIVFDLGDVRDFLPGSINGGLVVNLLNGAKGRAPYILPYVQPSQRISMPISSELAFSKRVWELAADFYSKFPLALQDADFSFIETIKSLKIGGSTMQEICEWHAKRIFI